MNCDELYTVDIWMFSFYSSSCYLLPKLDHVYLLVNVSTAPARDQYLRPGFASLPSAFFTHDPQIHTPHLTVSSPSLIKPVLERLLLSFCLALVVNRVCYCLNIRKQLLSDVHSLW